MAAPAILKIDVIADATKALKALGQTEKAAKGTSGTLGGLGKLAAGAVGTAAIVSFGKASVGAALESEKATARLEQVFRATGDTTGKAAKQAENYAAAMSKKTAIDDEAIMASQALLASFSNVSNEAARGAGVFDRATAASADLAAAGFGSMDGNAKALGKALQDPTKGLASLGKAGVKFTDQQKDQIAALQQSGDLLGAQNAVLAAVEGKVKGTAEATATSSDKMTLAFGETQEAVGGALLPVLEKLAPILQSVATFIQENVDWLLPAAAAIAGVVVAWKAWNAAIEIWNALATLNPWVAAIAAVIAIIVLVVKHWDKIKAAAQAVFDWVKKNWPLLLAIITGPIGLAVLAVTKHWDTIKRVVLGVFDAIKEAVTGAWRWVTDKFDRIASAVTDTFDGVKEVINGFIRGWNRLRVPQVKFDIPGGSFLPGVPDSVTIGGWNLPDLPLLATGGTVLQTGLAVVHAGEQFSGVGRTFGGDTTINVHVTAAGLGADSPTIQRAVVSAIRGYVSRNGALDVKVRSAV